MKNKVIKNSGEIIFSIGDLLKSDEFLVALKYFLNTIYNINKNQIYSLFNKIKNNSELEKEELTYIYYFLNTIGKNNTKNIPKYSTLIKLKNYIFSELYNNKNGLIDEIKNHIFNLLNIKSFEIKSNTQPEEYYGDIGIIIQAKPEIGYIIGSKGFSKINKRNGKLEITTGDLGIGNIYLSLEDIEILKENENIYIYGDNGIAIINISTFEVINKIENLGIGKIGEKKSGLFEDEFYFIGTKGIIQLDEKKLEVLTRITYKNVLEDKKKINREKKTLTSNDLENLIEKIIRNNNLFTHIVDGIKISNILKTIDFNLNEIKKHFNNLKPLELSKIINLLTGVPTQDIKDHNIESNKEINRFRKEIGFNESELSDEEFLLFFSYISNKLYDTNNILGIKYKQYLIDYIILFAKNELPNIDKKIISNIDNLVEYINYYISNEVDKSYINKKGKNEDFLLASSLYKEKSISNLQDTLSYNPFLQSILEKIELHLYTEIKIDYPENKIEYIGEGFFMFHLNRNKIVYIKNGKTIIFNKNLNKLVQYINNFIYSSYSTNKTFIQKNNQIIDFEKGVLYTLDYDPEKTDTLPTIKGEKDINFFIK